MTDTRSQESVIAFLSDPTTHGGAAVERVDTHAAVVFLAGDRALKLKRAVRFDYLDFSTPASRRAACEAEIRINQPGAPDIYRGVLAVTRGADGRLALGGDGAPVDWLVDMRRFDQTRLFDRLAASHSLPLDAMRPLASAIAAFHRRARHRADHGGAAGMRWVVGGNADGFAEHGRGILDAGNARALTARTLGVLDQVAPLLDRRRAGGFVRECHGDLHLRNIVLLDRGPALFDAIEFNEELSCVDVFYDLAFLLMDLLERGLPAHANAVLNGYLAETGDVAGLQLLPLFLSCRAAVRAKTSATASRVQDDAGVRSDLEQQARDYLAMAERLLAPAPARLVAIGGLSATGKSTLAYAWAPEIGPPPGAIVLRSDEIRKTLLGVPVTHRLGSESYTPEASARVYAALAARAREILIAGHAVVADAVFGNRSDREAIEAVAGQTGRDFTGVWLEARREQRLARAEVRRGDASDATREVIERQHADAGHDLRWHRLDADRAVALVLESARPLIGDQRTG